MKLDEKEMRRWKNKQNEIERIDRIKWKKEMRRWKNKQNGIDKIEE